MKGLELLKAYEMASKLGVKMLDARQRYDNALVLEMAKVKDEYSPKIRAYHVKANKKKFLGCMYASRLWPFQMSMDSPNLAYEFACNLKKELSNLGGKHYEYYEFDYIILSGGLLRKIDKLKDNFTYDAKSQESSLRYAAINEAYKKSISEEFLNDVCSGKYDGFNEEEMRVVIERLHQELNDDLKPIGEDDVECLAYD